MIPKHSEVEVLNPISNRPLAYLFREKTARSWGKFMPSWFASGTMPLASAGVSGQIG
jgi:hypothetical protein